MGTSPKRASGADQQIGRNIRLHRTTARMSQTALGAALGVTYQQVQKYEAGTNRVSSGRLTEIAQVLGVPLTELLGNHANAEPGNGEARPPQVSRVAALLSDRDVVRLVDAFARVKTERERRALVAFAEAMGGLSADEEPEADPAG
jgi:transcriptional regulator with XRE-family HTH domain